LITLFYSTQSKLRFTITLRAYMKYKYSTNTMSSQLLYSLLRKLTVLGLLRLGLLYRI